MPRIDKVCVHFLLPRCFVARALPCGDCVKHAANRWIGGVVRWRSAWGLVDLVALHVLQAVATGGGVSILTRYTCRLFYTTVHSHDLGKTHDMKTTRFFTGLLAAALISFASGCTSSQGVDLGYKSAVTLSAAEVEAILDNAHMQAEDEPSLLRVDGEGKQQMTQMHIIVVDRAGEVIGRRSMDDAWGGSVAIAKSKAYSAVAFSSDENALTTRSLGALTQPGGPLWNIGNSNATGGNPGLIEFPGGVPLYKDGVLVGAIGVSGDGVEQDENVADAGAKGYEPDKAIRIDTVTDGGVPYTK